MSPRDIRLLLPGIALFLFIPAVLYLLVRHSQPTWMSVGAALLMMIGHRFLARPHMIWVARRKCLWSNRPLGSQDARNVDLQLRQGSQEARCLPEHLTRLLAFFDFAYRRRVVLALGIFVPLLALIVHLFLVAMGVSSVGDLAMTRAIFQLAVGCTVNLAAWGFLGDGRPVVPPRILFPAHNFFLLGVGNLLWIFRLVGIWWIVSGITAILAV